MTPPSIEYVLAGSRIYRLYWRFRERLSNVRGTARAADALRRSYLYRWLAAEPDPEVIVIDLRETRTVGPLVERFAATAATAAPIVADSSLAATGRWGYERTLEAPVRVGGVLAGAFGIAAVVAGVLGVLSTAAIAVGVVALGVAAMAVREDRSWKTLRTTRTVGVLVAAFEPPEPPDDETRRR